MGNHGRLSFGPAVITGIPRRDGRRAERSLWVDQQKLESWPLKMEEEATSQGTEVTTEAGNGKETHSSRACSGHLAWQHLEFLPNETDLVRLISRTVRDRFILP